MEVLIDSPPAEDLWRPSSPSSRMTAPQARREAVLSTTTAVQMVQLGEALRELARSTEEDGPTVGTPWRRRLRTALNGVALFAGELLIVLGRLELQRPSNWPTTLTYGRLQTVIKDGFPVLWVPAAEVLDAMAEAPDRPARQRVLLDRRDEVLEHAQTVLAEVRSPDLAVDRQVVAEALACVRNQPSPAQVAALNVAVNRALLEAGARSLGQLARMGQSAADRGPMIGVEDLRSSLMLVAVAPALEHFDPAKVDHVHARPNRHVVDHATSAVQYTPGNALESVLLAVSVLRQAQANREGAPPQRPVTLAATALTSSG